MTINFKKVRAVLFRTIGIFVWIFCFWSIRYIVVHYIHPEIPITPDMSAKDRNISEFNNSGILQKQFGDTFIFSFIFCFFIVGYYFLLNAIKHKKNSRIKIGKEKIAEQRKIIFSRLIALSFFMVFMVCCGVALKDKSFGGWLIANLILFSSLGPLYIFYGLSKAYSCMFALKIIGCTAIVLIIAILFKIPPHFAPLAGALPFSISYARKLDGAWEPFRRL